MVSIYPNRLWELSFDTGQGLALINNARVLRKDLTSIKGIVLSHHHFDHTGGL